MAIVLRQIKGSQLTHTELDNNFVELRDGLHLKAPKEPGNGIKLGPNGSAAFGWHDLLGSLDVHENDPTAPAREILIGGIKQHAYSEGQEAQVSFHIPHDYLPGSDIYIHAHWCHNSNYVIGGSITWGFELTYAAGHGDGVFSPTITVVEIQAVPTIPLTHMICEAPVSIIGGSANLLDTSSIITDGLLFGTVYLDSNDIQVSQGLSPKVFLHQVDIHYQSTGIPTINRSPDFWA